MITVLDLQRLAIEASPIAFVAGHIEIGQEVHFDLGDALPLARFAASTLDVEAESAGAKPQLLGVTCGGKHFADFVEHAGIGGRIAAGRAADRRLVDLDHLVDLACAPQAGVGPRLGGDAAQFARSRRAPAFR